MPACCSPSSGSRAATTRGCSSPCCPRPDPEAVEPRLDRPLERHLRAGAVHDRVEQLAHARELRAAPVLGEPGEEVGMRAAHRLVALAVAGPSLLVEPLAVQAAP